MITAIFVILMLSTVGAYIVNVAGKTLKSTSTQYYKEQSALLAKSYTELAIMGATANDAKNTNCLETINGVVGNNPDNGEGYRVTTTLSYIGDDTLACNNANIIISDALIPENQLYVMVDVYVRYRDYDVINAIVDGGGTLASVPWITYHRRTLQRL
jgi:hypothetical protein